MSITATELKSNLSKYLMLASKEDIYITQYGKVVAKLTNPFQDRLAIAESLFGSVPATMTLEEAREERLGNTIRCFSMDIGGVVKLHMVKQGSYTFRGLV